MKTNIASWILPCLLMLGGVECHAQVNARQKLIEAQQELERYIGDEGEYLKRTKQHYGQAVDHLLGTLAGQGIEWVYGKTSKEVFNRLTALAEIADAGRQG